MFKCRDCKCEFEYPHIEHESRGEFWGAPCWEDVGYCPSCGSEDFDELHVVVAEEEEEEEW